MRSRHIREGESRGVAAAVLTLAGILAGHTLLETARDTLFLSRLPPSHLPWMYLAILAASAPLSLSRSTTRRSGGRGLALLLALGAAVTAGFEVVVARGAWALYALYLWGGILGTAASVRFWLALGDAYTITQAKRLYAVIGGGGMVGAVLGAAAARLLIALLRPEALLVGAGLAFAAAAAAAAWLPGGEAAAGAGGRTSSFREAARLARRMPYLKLVGGLIFASTMAVTFADYLFKAIAARAVPADRLGAYFATVYLAINVLALGVQLLLVAPVLGRMGAHRAAAVLPTLLLGGALAITAGGGLPAALFLKASDGALRHSLQATALEVLHLPLSDSLRFRIKPLMDLVGRRGGQALASALIIALGAFGGGSGAIAAALALVSATAIASSHALVRHYVELFRTALREGRIETRVPLPALDLASLEAIMAALNSPDDAEVAAALELLAARGRVQLVPALLLHHPSAPIVTRALALFARAGRRDVLPLAERLAGHGDPTVRAAALQARAALGADAGSLRPMLEDPDARVRAAASVALAHLEAGGAGHGSWLATAEDRQAIARAIRERPSPIFADLLLRLADAAEPETRGHAAAAMGAIGDPRFLPILSMMLGERTLRPPARASLVSMGLPALAYLGDRLRDESLPMVVRRHLPRTISRFPAADAGPVLLARLLDERDGAVRHKILRGLGRIRTDHPDVRLADDAIRRALDASVAEASRLARYRGVVDASLAEPAPTAVAPVRLLRAILEDELRGAMERVFRLLALLHPPADIERIHRGLRSTSAKVRAGSRELLEHLLRPPLRQTILQLLDGTGNGGSRHAEPLCSGHSDARSLIEALLDEPNEPLRSAACHCAAGLGMYELTDKIAALVPCRAGSYLPYAVSRALAALRAGSTRA